MASLLSHPAIPVGLYLARKLKDKKLFLLCCFLTILPDADAIGFWLGVPYESQWGHRGFTHSLAFALGMGALCSFFHEQFQTSRWKVFLFTFTATLSHPLLDALTNGGLGVALLWPLTNERFFFPLRPIQVSPIGIFSFFGLRGLQVILSEFLWVWLPVLCLTFLVKRRQR